MVLAGHLGLLVRRIVEHLAVHVAENVVAHPTHHLQVPPGEHRGQHALHQRLARLAVATVMASAAKPGSSSMAAGDAPSEGVKFIYE